MSPDDFYHPEDTLGKVYDNRLIRRVLKYAKPYWSYIFASILMAVLLSGSEIILPYITKIGIDDCILVKYKKLKLSEASEARSQQNLSTFSSGDSHWNSTGDLFFKDGELDPKLRYEFESKQLIEANNYYFAKLSKYDAVDGSRVEGIAKAHPEIFQFIPDASGFFIQYKDFDSLTEEERQIIRYPDKQGTVRLSILFIGILVVSFCVMFIQVITMTWVGQKVMFDIRTNLFSHIQKLPIAFFNTQPTGRLVTRVSNDVDALNEMFTTIIIDLFKNLLLLIGIMIAMLSLSHRLAFVTFSLLPAIIIITWAFKRKMRDAYRKVRIKIAQINATLAEHISGIKLIQTFAREMHHFSKFRHFNDDYYRANIHQLLVQSAFSPFIVFIENLGIGLILYYGGGQIIQNEITLGSLVAFLSYLSMFFGPVRDIAEKFNILQSAMAASERIFQLMDRRTENADNQKPESIRSGKLKGGVEFRNVWFAYEGEDWVLQDVSFIIEPGQTVAFVGATGSGKSTIINLISKFYKIQKGEILIDGIDIDCFDQQFLRRQISLVLQDVFLFSGDFYRNIRLNEKNIEDPSVEQSAKLVYANTFIEKYESNYRHPIQEGGTTLSQGQRQLIAFARALAFNPAILILDEATSNIDSETEFLIQNALTNLLRSRTSIVVAHRLSTIKKANKIIVMHRGKIKEIGDHQGLLALQGVYYRLYQMQYRHQETLL